jgi:hypothetical protein
MSYLNGPATLPPRTEHQPDDTSDTPLLACLGKGTRIATLRGLCPVEELEPGDRIVTHSRSVSRLRALRRIEMQDDALGDDPAAVAIVADAFGPERPLARLVVSAQQPVFVKMTRGSGGRNRYNDTVPARYLVNDETVCAHDMRSGEPFYALSFERPEVIQAENIALLCPSEVQMRKLARG